MNLELSVKIIKDLATEIGFDVSHGNEFEIKAKSGKKDRVHSESYKIIKAENKYLRVQKFNGNEYGTSVYALRDLAQVIKFCNIMITGKEIQAG